MCPSYRATGEEHHSTRGRARLLWEMLRGHEDSPITDGWRSTEVRDALDLCLSCKGCLSDCPVNVDMATYKAEFLHHHYEGRQWRRPRSHLVDGLAAGARPRRVTARAAGQPDHVVPGGGRCSSGRAASTSVARSPRSPTPRFTPGSRERGSRGSGERGEVLLWPDTFTDYLRARGGDDAVRVLEAAGFTVRAPGAGAVLRPDVGDDGSARRRARVLGRTLDALAPAVGDGDADRRARAELHGGVHRRRPEPAARAPRRRDRRGDDDPRAAAGRARAGLGAAAGSPGAR